METDMTTIGSEIIKRINILHAADFREDTNSLNTTILKGLLQKYFQSIIPLSASEPETPSEPLSEAEIEYLTDLNRLKQNLANFIIRCLKPESYTDLLKIINSIEEIAELNLPGKLAIENQFNRKFTNSEIDMLISTNTDEFENFVELFIPLNELLKVHLDSDIVYKSIKAYKNPNKNPEEDNRTLIATFMMLLSDDKSGVYILDTDVDQIVNSASESVDLLAALIAVTPIIFMDESPATVTATENIPMAVTPILSAQTKPATSLSETGFSKIIRPPLGVYFNSNRQTTVIPISNQQSNEATCPKMSPISSPKYSAIKRYAANNSMGT
jgi:hypothetical protein